MHQSSQQQAVQTHTACNPHQWATLQNGRQGTSDDSAQCMYKGQKTTLQNTHILLTYTQD